jgi:hypothetical protein
MPSVIPASSTGLYWNTRGNIRCEPHARELEPLRWDAEGWMPIPTSEEPQQRRYQCQKCSSDGNAISTYPRRA